MVEKSIHKLFENYPDVLYGYTDISYSPFVKEYKSAFVFAVPYGKQLTIENYSEKDFEQGILDARKRLEMILEQIEEVLKLHKIKYYIPPVAQESEQELLAPFSFKYATVNAGLGWIGKNDVLITKKYGPRVRLSAILIDCEFTYGQKITESQCPDYCQKCVDICPYHALHNKKWNMDVLRSDIIDYHLCNQKRSLYIEKHGRKNSCGLCLAVCPFGVSNFSELEDSKNDKGSIY